MKLVDLLKNSFEVIDHIKSSSKKNGKIVVFIFLTETQISTNIFLNHEKQFIVLINK